MKAFLTKLGIYSLLILLALEILVRVFHLYTEDPPRFIDAHGVEKRVPGNTGFAVYGNRNQRFSRFHINQAGFNSHREFEPAADSFEMALIGDSFIEGFHQDYTQSIGQKIESHVPGTAVYEYGYAGYDLANQLHLIQAYRDDFELIDEIIVYLNYESDLERAIYVPNTERIQMLRSPIFKLRDHVKILAYGSKIGILQPFKKLVTGKAFSNQDQGQEEPPAYRPNLVSPETQVEQDLQDRRRISNFRSLVRLYGFDKKKTTLLLDSRRTSPAFLAYCREQGIRYIDFAEAFEQSKEPTTLIYDWHWNDHGREMIAQVVSQHLKKKYGQLDPRLPDASFRTRSTVMNR